MKLKVLFTSLALGLLGTGWSAPSTPGSVLAKKNAKKSISLYQPWAGISGGIIDTMGLHPHQRVALHGAVHQAPNFFGLEWDTTGVWYEGLTDKFTPASISKALLVRDSIRALNPNIFLIGEIRVYDADTNYLPKNHIYWVKEGGQPKRNPGWPAYYLLNIQDQAWQQAVGRKCKALIETEVVDGCKLDWATNNQEAMFKEIRKTVGDSVVLIGNINHNIGSIEKILPLLNGGYMECVWWGDMLNKTTGHLTYWNRVKETIKAAEANMREPKILGTEIWSHPDSSVDLVNRTIPESQLNMLRAGTALHYALSNGYVSYFPQPFFKVLGLPEHVHVYHPFLNASLGTPGAKSEDGKILKREWSNGTVVYNPPDGANYTITFSEMRRSQKTGVVALTHTVPAYDGDIFLKGTYTQMYPVKSSTLPFEKLLPDTNYKSGLSPINSKGAKASSIKQFKLNNQNNILFKFQVEGEKAKFYNTEGREIKTPEGYIEK